MATFTPREIVSELDRYIVGQRDAKRAVAIALRNRWRRLQVPEPLRDEIAPKNIIMIGPTGVGKTEISRRLAKLAQAPFVKVEASKFTEVGYVGRDVESIIRDLIELAVTMVREEEKEKNRVRARELAEERLLDLLLPPAARPTGVSSADARARRDDAREAAPHAARGQARRAHRRGRGDEAGLAHDRGDDAAGHGGDREQPARHAPEPDAEAHQDARPCASRRRSTSWRQEEAATLIDQEAATREAIRRVEQSGIVFLDEIDKIAGPRGRARARRVARGRAARPAADRRGLDGVDQARPGADRSRALHRVRARSTSRSRPT